MRKVFATNNSGIECVALIIDYDSKTYFFGVGEFPGLRGQKNTIRVSRPEILAWLKAAKSAGMKEVSIYG